MDNALKIKLARLCGMFGSEFEGERANAAKAADDLIRKAGLTWYIVLGIEASTITELEMLKYCEQRGPALSMWEAGFIDNISNWVKKGRALTEKQKTTLQNIYMEQMTGQRRAQ
jgi:hypothetical protein